MLALLFEREDRLKVIVQHQHEGRPDGPEHVGARAFEERRAPLVLEDLCQTVEGPLVVPFRARLLRLHLQAAADGVEGVGGVTRRYGGQLGDPKFRRHPNGARVVLPGVAGGAGVVKAEVHPAVGDDSHDGHAEAVVETQEPLGSPRRLAEAVPQAVKVSLAGADV